MIDRYIVSLALQLWQRFFQLALDAGVVSNREEHWLEHRISALEYLARGKLMAVASLFFDGPVVKEEGDIDLFQAAQRGVLIAFGGGHDDPAIVDAAKARLAELLEDLASKERELEKLLADRFAYIAGQGPGAVALELARCPELIPQHRAWLGSPIAAARGAMVASEIEAQGMPPTSSAPADNPGFNPAFFPPAQQDGRRGPHSSRAPRAVPATVPAELEPPVDGAGDEPPAAAAAEPPATAFNPNMTLFRPGKSE